MNKTRRARIVEVSMDELTLNELLFGRIFGSKHSSPLKYTLVGKPSPATTLMPGVFFFVNEITDCCLPALSSSTAANQSANAESSQLNSVILADHPPRNQQRLGWKEKAGRFGTTSLGCIGRAATGTGRTRDDRVIIVSRKRDTASRACSLRLGLRRPMIFQFWGGVNEERFRSGGILNTFITNAETDLLGSIAGGKIVPFLQQKGTFPRAVSFAFSSGKSITVGLLSQFNTFEKSSSIAHRRRERRPIVKHGIRGGDEELIVLESDKDPPGLELVDAIVDDTKGGLESVGLVGLLHSGLKNGPGTVHVLQEDAVTIVGRRFLGLCKMDWNA
nr:hypothetical protein EUGRSUZ_K03515 [Ipomoea trifida]